jgi:hypothetical protein
MMQVIDWIPGQKIKTPGVYRGVPSAIYHGPDLCAGPSISSSGLRTIFTESPMDYWIYSPHNPARLVPPESRALVLGRAAHHLCLGEADFKKFFVVRPEEYPDKKTGVLKKWTRQADFCKAWEAERADLDILTPAELETIKGLAGIQPWQKGLEDSGLMNNAVVRAGALQGLVEHTIIAIDKETGVYLKARPDVIPTASKEASDFKSTQSVEAYKLQRTLDEYRYDMQGELISRCLEQAADFRLTNFALIFACKPEPHEVAVRELKPFDMDESAKDNQAAIRTFALCMERGRWPGVGGGEADARYLERSDRSRERAALRREQLDKDIFG